MIPPILFSVAREFHAERLNAVVNHPEVRGFVGPGTNRIDLTQLVANPANVLLMREGGGLFFGQHEEGIYEVHTQFVPEARGEIAVEATRDALRWMFTHTDAREIVTKVDPVNKGALGLVRAIHGELRFKRGDIGHYALPIDAWAGKCQPLEISGNWFHEKLETAKIAMHAAIDIHAYDEFHDRYVGATVEMILAGQIDKAVRFYNRWANFSGYGTVSVITNNPVVIDTGDALIAVRENDFEVILCR